MNAKDEVTVSLTDMTNRLKNSIKLDFEVERMEPLFATEEDYEAFNKRQSAYQVKKGDLSQYHGNCYLVLMQAPPPPRLLLWVRTEPCLLLLQQ